MKTTIAIIAVSAIFVATWAAALTEPNYVRQVMKTEQRHVESCWKDFEALGPKVTKFRSDFWHICQARQKTFDEKYN